MTSGRWRRVVVLGKARSRVLVAWCVAGRFIRWGWRSASDLYDTRPTDLRVAWVDRPTSQVDPPRVHVARQHVLREVRAEADRRQRWSETHPLSELSATRARNAAKAVAKVERALGAAPDATPTCETL